MKYKSLITTVYIISFCCGLTLCFENVFLPEFKILFNLTYTEQMYTMFAKNIPFMFFSIFIGYLTERIGYKNCLVISLLLFCLGSALIVPGINLNNYSIILLAFFIIGIGFNFETVAGSALLSSLGEQRYSAARLNIANSIGAVSQIVAPLLLSFIIPKSSSFANRITYAQWIFIVVAILLAILAIATFIFSSEPKSVLKPDSSSFTEQRGSLKETKVLIGFVAIFLLLGGESALFGLYQNYLQDTSIAGLKSLDSQRMFTVYFGVFALGRLVGSFIQKRVNPAHTLLFCLSISIGFIPLIMTSHGMIAVLSVTAIGFFSSIFFPTMYAVIIEGVGNQKGQVSGLLMMGFLGGAIIPVFQGKLADLLNLQTSYVILLIPYLFAMYYLLFVLKVYRQSIITTSSLIEQP